MPTPDSVLQHRAAELVLHYQKSLGQSARILGTSVPAVQKLVNQFLDEHPQAVPSTASSDNAFLSVVLAEPTSPVDSVVLDDPTSAVDVPVSAKPVPLDIVTPSGLTLHLQLGSIYEVAVLLQSLEHPPC